MAVLGVGLTPEQLERRRQGIGGSDAVILLSGVQEDILQLWREKRGEAEHEDLSDVLAVQMGQWTEPLNLYWFEKKTNFHVKQKGLEIAHESMPHMLATLDGVFVCEEGDGVLEAKHVNSYHFVLDKIVNNYYPQLQHNMLVSGLEFSALSIFIGSMQWQWEMVRADASYQKTLVEREAEFWNCVVSGRIPGKFDAVEPNIPIPPGKEIISLDGDNEFATAAYDYLRTMYDAKLNKISAEKIRDKVPPHVGGVKGHGVIVKRQKNGSLRIGKEK